VILGRRRDPFMFVGLQVSDVDKTVKTMGDNLGLTQQPYPIARPVANSPFEPAQPKKSVYLGFDPESTGSKKSKTFNFLFRIILD